MDIKGINENSTYIDREIRENTELSSIPRTPHFKKFWE